MATPEAAPVNVNDPGDINQPLPGNDNNYIASLSQLSIDEYLPTNVPENIPEEEKAFCIACAKRPYLDSKYFEVNFEQSTPEGNIVAVCKTCVGTYQSYTWYRLTVSSNYTTHLRVC